MDRVINAVDSISFGLGFQVNLARAQLGRDPSGSPGLVTLLPHLVGQDQGAAGQIFHLLLPGGLRFLRQCLDHRPKDLRLPLPYPSHVVGHALDFFQRFDP
ncbi:MAG: hypothetical protein KGY46_11460, partial [Anaerolineales bacterium]|nr:hypothetical protein [Anaerolineales bacterium]